MVQWHLRKPYIPGSNQAMPENDMIIPGSKLESHGFPVWIVMGPSQICQVCGCPFREPRLLISSSIFNLTGYTACYYITIVMRSYEASSSMFNSSAYTACYL